MRVIPITNVESLNNFLSENEKRNFILIPFLLSPQLHYMESDLAFIVCIPVDDSDIFVINFLNYDLPTISFEYFLEKWNRTGDICIDLGAIRKYGKEGLDCSMIFWYFFNEVPSEISYNYILKPYRRNKIRIDQFGRYASISAVIEHGFRVRDLLLKRKIDINQVSNNKGFNFYNDIALNAWHYIERAGIAIQDVLGKRIVFSKANPYTMLGRPTFTANGINLSSLDKQSGSRSRIVSRFDDGKIVEIDYSSFHIYLISKFIGYSFPTTNIHEFFGKQYFGVEHLTSAQYEEAKRITFKQLYYEVESKYLNNDFFLKFNEFKRTLVEQIRKSGVIEMPISGRKFDLGWMDGSLPDHKLMNYFFQMMETELNVITLLNVMKQMDRISSTLFLYVYDAFLFDFKSSELQILPEIKKIIESVGIPAKVKMGVNYHEIYNVQLV